MEPLAYLVSVQVPVAISLTLCTRIILKLPVKVSLSAEFPHCLHIGEKKVINTGHSTENAVALESP